MVVSVCNLKDAAKAAHYYEAENYYAKNEGIEQSEWYGKGAVGQGLSNKIKPQEFEAALHGKAANGTQLIADRTNRRLGTDVTFSASKSVSIEALVRGDERIIAAHIASVKAALEYVERELIQTRITRNKQTYTEKTGNIQVALWQHDTSRQKDPQLHTHCVILNQTQCQDGKWRTIDNSEIFQHQLLVGAIYHNALAYQLEQLGYRCQWKADATFELAGYTSTQLAQFSSRRQEIVAAVGAEASAQKRAFATLQTRSAKQPDVDRSALQQQWRLQAQAVGIEYASDRIRQERKSSCKSIVQNAQEVLLERDVAFSDKQLFREALRQNQGATTPTEVEQEIQRQRLEGQLLTTKDGQLTTAAALERERQIVSIALRGKASLQPIATPYAVAQIARSKNFTPGQRAAIELAATSTDRVILIQGDAGTGKTYALNGLRELTNARQLRGLAPSASAAVTLETESGIPSQTLDSYLLSPNTPKGETLILDEAGLMSSRQAVALLSKAQQQECRVILIGDTKQLSSVEAGCPFRLLQRAGVQTAQMTENRRQKDAELKAAIDLAAAGQIAESYERLEQSGRIALVAARQERTAVVAQDYLARNQKEREQTLILTGTNQERDEITSVIRAGLLVEGSLGSQSMTVQTLKSKNLDSWEKKQAAYYELDDIVTFNVDYKNFQKSEPYRVTGIDPNTNTITLTDSRGREHISSCTQHVNREVYQLRSLELRVGDKGRFTKNDPKSKQINGQAFRVTDINPQAGEMTILTKGWSRTVRAADLIHADYNYVSTTYSSQGKTKDAAIWCVDTAQPKLLGKEAYYVAISRVRHDLKIYASDIEALSCAIAPSRVKANASELLQAKLEKDSVVQPNEASINPQPVGLVGVASQPERNSFAETSPTPTGTLPQAENNQQSRQQPVYSSETPEEASNQSQAKKEDLLNESDEALVAKVQAVQEWRKNRPREPVVVYGERLKNRVIELKQQKANLEKQQQQQSEELAKLGKPRSLFNPFGPSADLLDYKQLLLRQTRADLCDVDRQLSDARATFKAWQQKAKQYLDWQNSPHTQQMQQLSEALETPQVQERLWQIQQGYSLHNAAQFILKAIGTQENDCCYSQGKFYRIEERGATLTIWHQRQEQPIYSGIALRERGGIIAINQKNFTKQDLETLLGYAHHLKLEQEQELQRSRQRERAFGIGR
jgi:conjugative relaxase-like TrwC/TraI family protein